jgi:hypothetical protein
VRGHEASPVGGQPVALRAAWGRGGLPLGRRDRRRQPSAPVLFWLGGGQLRPSSPPSTRPPSWACNPWRSQTRRAASSEPCRRCRGSAGMQKMLLSGDADKRWPGTWDTPGGPTRPSLRHTNNNAVCPPPPPPHTHTHTPTPTPTHLLLGHRPLLQQVVLVHLQRVLVPLDGLVHDGLREHGLVNLVVPAWVAWVWVGLRRGARRRVGDGVKVPAWKALVVNRLRGQAHPLSGVMPRAFNAFQQRWQAT